MQLSLSSSKYDKEISMSVYGAKDIQIVKQDTYYGLCNGQAPAHYIG